MSPQEPISLYVHYPFCVRKCRYCDFLSGPAGPQIRERYLRALEREIRLAGRKMQRPVDTVFLGGGTPSLMSAEELSHLMKVLQESFSVFSNAEITMECNPGTVDEEKLCAFRKAGVNRLSIGVQSFRDEELRLLGRIHTADEARACAADARRAGFENLSLDLMSALPGQTYNQWMESLREAAALSPEHISAYSLILEEGTPLREEEEQGKLPPLPEEEEDRAMYHDTESFLARYGYHRYEISNYARDGFESRHNSGYWTGHPYLGLGTGAASYLGNRRWSNVRSLARYLEILEKTDYEEASMQIRENEEILDEKDQMAEFMFLGLRRMEGVSEQEFRQRFHRTMDEVYGPVIRRYQELDLLKRTDGRIFLTRAGIDVSNTVMSDFLLDP